MNAWQHHPNMAFLDSASSLCCHESVSVRWLNLSWSWPHFAVQSGRATTSLYPQLHIALKQVTGPSEEEGPMLHDSTSCQRTMKNLFGTTLNPQKYAKLASPSVLFHAWGTHQRGSLPRVGIAFVTLLDTWVDKYQKRVSQCSLRWGERRNLIKSLCMFRLWRRIESMWINKIVCVWMLWIKSKNIIVKHFHSNDEIIVCHKKTHLLCVFGPLKGRSLLFTCNKTTNGWSSHTIRHLLWSNCIQYAWIHTLDVQDFGPNSLRPHVFFRGPVGSVLEHLTLQIFTPRLVVSIGP